MVLGWQGGPKPESFWFSLRAVLTVWVCPGGAEPLPSYRRRCAVEHEQPQHYEGRPEQG